MPSRVSSTFFLSLNDTKQQDEYVLGPLAGAGVFFITHTSLLGKDCNGY